MVRFRIPSRRRGASRPVGVAGKLGLTLFFFVFFAMGSAFEVFTIREFARAVGQRSWQKVPCRIVASEVQERNHHERPFVFSPSYEYEHGGQTHTGTAYKRSYNGSEKYSQAQKLVGKYPAGLATSAYVNPQRPSEAVLKRESLLVGLMVLFPLIFVLVGAGGIYFIWRKAPPPKARPIAAGIVRKRGKGKYALAAFFAIFAVVGGGLLYPLGIKPISQTMDAESWVETPCKVLRAEVRSHDSDDGTTYSVYILYEYEIDGRTYKSDRYEFLGGSSSGRSGKARIVEQYKLASRPVCYVDPDDPTEAVLKRGFHAKLLLALLPLVFLLVGLAGIVGSLRKRKPKKKRDLSVLRQDATGPAVLEPKQSAAKKLIGIVVFAVLWNGIISIFLFHIIDSFRQGDPEWFHAVFMVPFVLVGLLLIALVIYQFLASFNPRPTLELSTATIPVGGAAELRWSFAGQTSRINEFTVTLRGVEQARYRRGTKTYTDKNTFYEMELYQTSSAAEMRSGQVGFFLPQETMHSFEATNNQILWNLDVHGDIKRWPDVKGSFKIDVVPAPV